MPSYYLKCKRKYRKHKSKSFIKLKMVKQYCYQNVPYLVVRNQELRKKRKQKEY